MKYDDSELYESVTSLNEKSQLYLEMISAMYAKKMEAYAKQNRPWTDRTGHARQRLKGWVESDLPNSIKIYIGHGVYYGKYLENKNFRKYQILIPTIKHYSEKVKETLKDCLKQINEMR